MLTSGDLDRGFTYLKRDSVFGSVDEAWRTLRGIYVRCIEEKDLLDNNNAFAGMILEGAEPQLAAVGLGDLVMNNLNTELDAHTIERSMVRYGLKRAQLLGNPTLSTTVRACTDRWNDTITPALLRPAIPRDESSETWERLQSDSRVLLAVGAAGGGKSAVAYEVAQRAESAGWPVLAFRLDRLEPISTPLDLGRQLDFSVSPVSALGAVSRGTPSLLLVDQLDAVSLAAGRMPTSFDAVASLMREASGFPDMRVMLVCRKFDVENDERIRAVFSRPGVTQVEIKPLSDDQVDSAVQALSLDPASLSRGQLDLLRSPFNLTLLRAIRDQGDALSFASSRDLLDAYWNRKLRDCRRDRPSPPRFNDVIGSLVDAMSQRQRLAVPTTVLDQSDLGDDARVLESEHILVRDGRNYAFFHEEFFGYAFARRWVEQSQTLVEFLLSGDQELFRRGQVRQVLGHLHTDEPERLIAEAEALLLHPDIRFHIKQVVLAFLRALPAPTLAEWEMMQRIFATEPDYVEQLWLTLRTLPWFDLLNYYDQIARWLASDEGSQTRALEVSLGGVKDRADHLARILAPHAGQHPNYRSWLHWIVRFADLGSSRKLLDLVIDGLRRGDYIGNDHDLWISAYNLPDNEPAWAADLLAAYLQDQPGALDIDDVGRVRLLQSSDTAATEIITKCADRAPDRFCEVLLPYLQNVFRLTEHDPDTLPIADRQFSSYDFDSHAPLHDLDVALVHGMRTALRRIVERDPVGARSTLDQLAADPHEAAQWLLYEGIQGAPEVYAPWVAGLLLDGQHRLIGGSPMVEACRHLLQKTSPHFDSARLAELERAILRIRVPWERRPSGWCMFNLLSALPQFELSDEGRRRLGELRRLFKVEQPQARPALSGGFIGSPIPQEAARHMTDAQWLRAMAKYSTDGEDWTSMRGGARELANLLQQGAVAEPERYARLAIQLTADLHPAYADGILIGLGNAQVDSSSDLVFAAVRHIGSLQHDDNDRWLSWPLRKHLDAAIPDDIVDLLLNRARHGTSPVGEHWQNDKGDSRQISERIISEGINSARGTCAERLGDILAHDVDGHRTAIVVPHLAELAADPSVAVRSCVAHLIAASLRHARVEAMQAFEILVRAEDHLLATHYVANLIVYVGHLEAALVEPVIRRMMVSSHTSVRKVGGELAGYAGLELGLDDLVASAENAEDFAVREGLAITCAARIPHTGNVAMAVTVLQRLANDPHEDVRKAVAHIAPTLRDHALRPYTAVLAALIGSPSFEFAIDQLLITLEHAPDRIDDLVIACAKRFIDVFGADLGNLSRSAAGNSDEVGRLVLRAYEQARTPQARSETLDLVDRLLLLSAYRVDELIEAAERS